MSNLYQVVNDDDEIVAYKLRPDIDFKKDIYRVSALWLTNSKGEVLIAQRLLTKDKDPGKWGPAAAGTLEEGETYESNAYKEAEEEIGLKGITLSPGPKMKFETPRKSFVQWYFGLCDWSAEQFVPQPEEVQVVKWIHLDELRDDVEKNPDKYVPSMPFILGAISS